VISGVGARAVVRAAGGVAEARALPLDPGFELALCGVLLSDGIDYEPAAELQARWPRIVVILMSGYAKDVVVRDAVTRGDVRFLQKPFDMASLSYELGQALGVRRSTQ
jgi:DNA-binding NtrC family response regulator